MCPTGEWGQDQEVLTRNESKIELEWLILHGQKNKAARMSKKKSCIAEERYFLTLFLHALD